MGWIDGIWQALTSLLLNKLRSVLTILGLSIGVGAIIAIGSLGYAGIDEVQAELNRFGVDRLWIAGKNDTALQEADVRLLDMQAPEMRFCPMRYSVQPATFLGKAEPVQLVGTTQRYLDIENISLLEGRFLLPQDEENALRVVVVEDLLCQRMGITEPIGQTIQIGNGKFVVVGVIKTVYSSIMGSDGAKAKAYMPLSCFAQHIGGAALDEITAQFEGDVDEAALRVKMLLAQNHPGQSYTISSLEGQITSARRILNIFTLVLVCVGVICMLTGGIGVMNVLLTAVRERRREIGIRKAIGARDRDIARQFMFEALMYGIIGAVAGCLLGLVLTKLGGIVVGIEPNVNGLTVAGAIFFSCSVGLVSGVYPAIRASKVPPVAAMRSAL